MEKITRKATAQAGRKEEKKKKKEESWRFVRQTIAVGERTERPGPIVLTSGCTGGGGRTGGGGGGLQGRSTVLCVRGCGGGGGCGGSCVVVGEVTWRRGPGCPLT